jgi:hypothetical protein
MTKSGPLRKEVVAALFRSRLCAEGAVTIFIIGGEREAGHGEIRARVVGGGCSSLFIIEVNGPPGMERSVLPVAAGE